MAINSAIINTLQKKVYPFNEAFYDVILAEIGDSSVVLLGEATHGTQEFYDVRAELTQRLILDKGFNAIAIEGDWPDAYNINKYINQQAYVNVQEALAGFDRFPTWMWQNVTMVELVEWLYSYNKTADTKINFYGLDLYSLYRSIDVIINYLKKIDPHLAQEAQNSYSCLNQFRHEPQLYGYSLFSRLAKTCQDEVLQEFKKIQKMYHNSIQSNTQEEVFYLLQNARLVKNAENYYRSLFINEINNWNIRDSHMMETIEEIIKHYRFMEIKNPKIIIWAHNSHIGNAAATQMSTYGEYNIGQLVKEKFRDNSYALGFTTYNGTVSAASNWHSPVERKTIRNALENSYEHLFHEVDIPNFFLSLKEKTIVPGKLLERAIGVVYLPQSERQSHYFYAELAYQFDGIVHWDTTTALEPLEKTTAWIEGEIPETYPTGL